MDMVSPWSTQELGFRALGPGGVGPAEWLTHALSVPSARCLFHGSLPVPHESRLLRTQEFESWLLTTIFKKYRIV